MVADRKLELQKTTEEERRWGGEGKEGAYGGQVSKDVVASRGYCEDVLLLHTAEDIFNAGLHGAGGCLDCRKVDRNFFNAGGRVRGHREATSSLVYIPAQAAAQKLPGTSSPHGRDSSSTERL